MRLISRRPHGLRPQLKVWGAPGDTLPNTDLAAIYRLLSGVNEETLHEPGLVWTTSFGLHLWYLTTTTSQGGGEAARPNQDLVSAVKSFDAAGYTAPVPWWQEQDRSFGKSQNEGPRQ